MTRLCWLCLSLFLALLSAAAAEDVFNVGPTRAYTNVSAAVAAASSGGKILIDAGTYSETIVISSILTFTFASFSGNPDVVLFAPLGANIITISASATVNFMNLNINGTQSQYICLSSTAEAVLVLNNVAVSGCSTTSGSGGAFNLAGGSLTATECLFQENTAYYGGAIYSTNGQMTLNNCLFQGNAAYNGGAIYLSNVQTLLADCSFSLNHVGSSGGAISASGSETLTITGGSFTNNSAVGGGAFPASGGAISSSAYLVINGTTFSNNFARRIGFAGAISCTSAEFHNVVFLYNQDDTYGAAFFSSASGSNCTFGCNNVNGYDGNQYYSPVAFSCTNCLFTLDEDECAALIDALSQTSTAAQTTTSSKSTTRKSTVAHRTTSERTASLATSTTKAPTTRTTTSAHSQTTTSAHLSTAATATATTTSGAALAKSVPLTLAILVALCAF